MRSLIALSLLFASVVSAQPPQVVTLPVISQPAHALLDVVRPLLGKDGSVSAFGDKLIIRGSKDDVAAVRRMLSEIDRPPRRLIIEVRLSGVAGSRSTQTGYGLRTDTVRLGNPPPEHGAALYHRDMQTRGRNDSVQRVQALDGRPALIRTGQSMPQYQAYQTIVGNRVVQGFDMQYRDTHSGFYALPRVHGDAVTIEIRQRDEKPQPSGRIDSQHAATVLRGKIGEWLTLGSTSSDDGDHRDRFGRHVRTQRHSDRQIHLRVVPVD